jgi:acetyl esterase/lipase
VGIRLLLFCALGVIQAGEIPLWPSKDFGAEKDTTTSKDGLVAGRPVIRLGHVTRPTLTVYQPTKNNTGAAVLVFPGGGYNILAMDLEGTEVCEWLQSIGVTAVLVKYRVTAGRAIPLEDAQRAMGMVRARAAEWGIDPKRIGVLGFSAGGHLAAALSNGYEKRTYPPVDESDAVSCRPDFALLIYPAYLVDGGLNVTANTPPTFLVQTEDDGVHVENSLTYYAALKGAKVPVEMHLYASGGHGYGLRATEKTVTTWPRRAEEWLRSLGILKQ